VTLELLHPAGRVSRVLVLGERCPAALMPPRATPAETGVELVLIAPSIAELTRQGWLAQAADRAAGALAEDGVVYAMMPRGARDAARRRLRAAGLVFEPNMVQFPGRDAPRYLVPLDAEVFRHALTRLVGARPRARRALVGLRRLPFGESLLAAALPAVAVIARHPGAPPLAAWVPERRPELRVVLATSWRGTRGPIVLHCYAGERAERWAVAKVGPASAREADLLERLGASAGTAGARVPSLLASGSAGDQPVLLETPVGGRPAAELLTRAPDRFAEVTGAVAGWLERWNAATARPTELSLDRLERDLIEPLAELEASLPEAAAYRAWLAERCHALAGAEVPLVAVHADLTMWNVLLDAGVTPGVIDWAEAEEAGLPLTDFFYAVVDAAAACDGYRSRPDALRACFEPGGTRTEAVGSARARLASSLALTPELIELSFHACWLRHARNEARSPSTADRPFLEIVRRLARRTTEAA